MVLRPRYGLSLCAGGGGLDMGVGLAEPGFTTTAYVEWEKYPRQCLIAAQRAGYLAPAPIWDDVKSFDGRAWRGVVDTILAGYPCQPFSQAGQRKGTDDPRHLWPDIARIIEQVRPRWVFLENVAGHVTLGADTVLRDLHAMGFATATGLFSAAETSAPHERLRWFTVAYCDREITGPDNREPDTGTDWRNNIGRSCGTDVGDASYHNDARRLDQRTDRAAPEGSEGQYQRRETPFGEWVRPEFGGTGNNLADTESPDRRGKQQAERTGCGRAGPTRNDRELADTSSAGPQGREWPRSPGQRNRAQAHGPASQFRRSWIYPPGPGNQQGWADVLRCAPYLAPAISIRDVKRISDHYAQMVAGGELAETEAESILRRLVDGMAGRSRILKLLGNGVYPLGAANAWRSLGLAHGLRPLDLVATNG